MTQILSRFPASCLLWAIATLGLAGCGTLHGAAVGAPRSETAAGCERPSFSRAELRFQCGDRVYDLLATPVRSEQVFDIVERVSYTRRHYLARAGAERYGFKVVQLEGDRFPRQAVLETRRGFARLLLDPEGNVVDTRWARDLGLD